MSDLTHYDVTGIDIETITIPGEQTWTKITIRSIRDSATQAPDTIVLHHAYVSQLDLIDGLSQRVVGEEV